MSMMVSFVLSFFPRDVLDEILNLIGSVSEGFPSYSCVESKTRSQSQSLEKPCMHSSGHSFDRIFMKLCQNINLSTL